MLELRKMIFLETIKKILMTRIEEKKLPVNARCYIWLSIA